MLSTDDRRRIRFWRPDTPSVDLGINFIDTAWFYGPFVANRLIFEALHPYPRLLACSPVILPIPGTSSLAHLEENWEARRIALSPQEMKAISKH